MNQLLQLTQPLTRAVLYFTVTSYLAYQAPFNINYKASAPFTG